MGNWNSKKGMSKEERAKKKAAADTNSAIEKQAMSDFKQDSQVIKLLLLGAGESGKSTLFKQMIQLYGSGFDKASLEGYKDNIHGNVIQGITILAQQTETLDPKFGCQTSADVQGAKDIFLRAFKAQQELQLTPDIAKQVTLLWGDQGIKKAFTQHRAKMQIPDSADYFFDNVQRLADEKYVPTYQDVLHCRARTTGIVETMFQIKKDCFKLMDVGGQRNERKKWIHCFEGVTAVLFVAAISEYDQVLFEDSTQNRMVEALDLFEEMCNAKWFERSSMILFLNKRDLFGEKIKKVDLSVCFNDYKEGPDEKKASYFIQSKFLARNHKPQKMKVFCHITCATDADNVKFTFNAVRQTIIDASLVRSGLQ
jgi:GTPase SAR1 family protein